MELDLALDREDVVLQPSDSADLLDDTVWIQQLERWLSSLCKELVVFQAAPWPHPTAHITHEDILQLCHFSIGQSAVDVCVFESGMCAELRRCGYAF